MTLVLANNDSYFSFECIKLVLIKYPAMNTSTLPPISPNLCWDWCGGTGGVRFSCREEVGIMSAYVWDSMAELQSVCVIRNYDST